MKGAGEETRRKKRSGNMIASFCHGYEDLMDINEAAELARQENQSFSALVVDLIKEYVRQKKAERGEDLPTVNPLNIKYIEKQQIKPLDDMLKPLVTLDKYVEEYHNSINSADMARIEGCAFGLMQKAKRRYIEIKRKEMFGSR